MHNQEGVYRLLIYVTYNAYSKLRHSNLQKDDSFQTVQETVCSSILDAISVDTVPVGHQQQATILI
jgi:hypothetical protein